MLDVNRIAFKKDFVTGDTLLAWNGLLPIELWLKGVRLKAATSMEWRIN